MTGSGSLSPSQEESAQRIRDLIAGYSQATDRRDAAAYAELWHPDAVLDLPPDGERHEGREAIVANAVTRLWTSPARSWHLPSNTMIDFLGERSATAVSTFFALTTPPDGPVKCFLGYYTDAFEQRDGVWRFAVRSAEYAEVGHIPVPGSGSHERTAERP